MRQLCKQGLWKMEFSEAFAKEIVQEVFALDPDPCLTWHSLSKGQSITSCVNGTVWYGRKPISTCFLGKGLSFVMHSQPCPDQAPLKRRRVEKPEESEEHQLYLEADVLWKCRRCNMCAGKKNLYKYKPPHGSRRFCPVGGFKQG